MKKIVFIIIAIALVVGLGFGVYYLFFKTDDTKDYGKYRTAVHIEYLEKNNEYTKGSYIVYTIYAFSDIKFEQIKYSISNAAEVNLTVKTGKAEEHAKHHKGAGEYYIDAGGQVILTNEMDPGHYVITFFAYDKNNTRYELTPQGIPFKITASTN